jgi:hypothetical protein
LPSLFVLGFWRGLTVHPAIHWGRPASSPDADAGLSTAILVGLWNYMGWDNASTVARDVENPQRNYPRAIIGAAIVTTSLTFCRLLQWPWAASPRLHHRFVGYRRRPARRLSLSMAVVAGGVICGIGMFNALMMSYTRLPIAMAADGMLPRIFRAPQQPRRSLGQRALLRPRLGARSQLPFEKLISIDLILYGTSLILEFLALIAFVSASRTSSPLPRRQLRLCLPARSRPHLLIAYALYASRSEKLGDPGTALANVSSLLFASGIALLGPLLYWFTALARRRALPPPRPLPNSAWLLSIDSLILFPIVPLSLSPSVPTPWSLYVFLHCDLLLSSWCFALLSSNCLIVCITRSRA